MQYEQSSLSVNIASFQDLQLAEKAQANGVFPGNDAEFRQAERDWYSFVAKLTEKLTEIDDTVPELPVKDVVSLCSGCFLCAILYVLIVLRIFRIFGDTP